jgi:hypothetical protein
MEVIEMLPLIGLPFQSRRKIAFGGGKGVDGGTKLRPCGIEASEWMYTEPNRYRITELPCGVN